MLLLYLQDVGNTVPSLTLVVEDADPGKSLVYRK